VGGFVALCGIVVVAATYFVQPGVATITIDPTTAFQEIRGWEATAEAGFDDETPSDEYLHEVLDAAADLGVSRLRLEVRSSYEHTRDLAQELRDGRISAEEWRCARYSTVNDNPDPRAIEPSGFQFADLDRKMNTLVMPYARRLAQQGDRLWLNVNYVAFTGQLCDGYNYVHHRPEEYAEFVLAVYQHLRDTFQITPDSWEVMLEPDNTKIWTAAAMTRAMVETTARLRNAGFTPFFIAPSTKAAGTALSYLDAIWAEPALRPVLGELSYHRYSNASASVITAIGRAAAQRGLAPAMLEKIGATVDDLDQDLTLAGASAWQQYVLGFPQRDNGGHYLLLNPSAPKGQRVRLSQTATYLRQYFRAFRPGARRIDAKSDHRAFRPVAARNRSGATAVVVNARQAGQVLLRGLTPGSYRFSCETTTDQGSQACRRVTTVNTGGTATIEMPGSGIFSLVEEPADRPR
jgi:hypothetical protein